jgi:glycerol kinase
MTAIHQYVGAIDQGTTSTRFILFNKAGRIASVAQYEHKQHFPQPAWVEHDAEEIWSMVQRTVGEGMSKAGAAPSQLAAIGITNQRETVVVWDRATGRPLYNALVWQDQRGAPSCERLSQVGGPDRFKAKTGAELSCNSFTVAAVAYRVVRRPALGAVLLRHQAAVAAG